VRDNRRTAFGENEHWEESAGDGENRHESPYGAELGVVACEVVRTEPHPPPDVPVEHGRGKRLYVLEDHRLRRGRREDLHRTRAAQVVVRARDRAVWDTWSNSKTLCACACSFHTLMRVSSSAGTSHTTLSPSRLSRALI